MWFFEETDTLIPAIEVDPNTVTPGVIGFVITLFVGLSVLFLIVDMTKRVRRVRYRALVNEQLDAEANPAQADSSQ